MPGITRPPSAAIRNPATMGLGDSQSGVTATTEAEVRELLAELKDLSPVEEADVALLLYMLADAAVEHGALTQSLVDDVEAFFLDTKLAGDGDALFGEDFFGPLMANMSADDVLAAANRVGKGRKLSRPKLEKLFAMLQSAGEISAGELDGLMALAEQDKLTDAAKEAHGKLVGKSLTVMLLGGQAGTEITSRLADYLIKDDSAVPTALLEARFLDATMDSATRDKLANFLGQGGDLSNFAMNRAREALAGNENAVSILGARMLADGKLSAQERSFLHDWTSQVTWDDPARRELHNFNFVNNRPAADAMVIDEARAWLDSATMADTQFAQVADAMTSATSAEAQEHVLNAVTWLVGLRAQMGASGPVSSEEMAALAATLAATQGMQGKSAWAAADVQMGMAQRLHGSKSPVEFAVNGVADGTVKSVQVDNAGPIGLVSADTQLTTYDPLSYQHFSAETGVTEISPKVTIDGEEHPIFASSLRGVRRGDQAFYAGDVNGTTVFFTMDIKTGETHVLPPVPTSPPDVPMVLTPAGEPMAFDGIGNTHVFRDGAWEKLDLPDYTRVVAVGEDGRMALLGDTRAELQVVAADGTLLQTLFDVALPNAYEAKTGTFVFQGDTLLVGDAYSGGVRSIDTNGGDQAPVELVGQFPDARAITFDHAGVPYYKDRFGAIQRPTLVNFDNVDLSTPPVSVNVDTGKASAAKVRSASRLLGRILRQDSPRLTARTAKRLVPMLRDLFGDDSGGADTIPAATREKIADQLATLYTTGDFDLETAVLLAPLAGEFDRDSSLADVRDALLAQGESSGKLSRAELSRLMALSGIYNDFSGMEFVDPAWVQDSDRQAWGEALGERLASHSEAMADAGFLSNWELVGFSALFSAFQDDLSPAHKARMDAALVESLGNADIFNSDVDALRPYFAARGPVDATDLMLMVAAFAQSDGSLSLEELQRVATAVDADGVRSEAETLALRRLAKLPMTSDAEASLERLLEGVTAAGDLQAESWTPDGPGRPLPDGVHDDVRVWTAENNEASDGAVTSTTFDPRVVKLFDDGSIGTKNIRVVGESILNTLNGHDAVAPGGNATTDAFDQINTLKVAKELLDRVQSYGINLDELQKNDTANDGILRLEANAFGDENAHYAPDLNAIQFGTSDGKWHLASDGDVVAHEIGHYLSHHINYMDYSDPKVGAMQEGFADIIASLLHNDPEISEDFVPGDGALRNADNDVKLRVDDAWHSGAEAYAGFAWRTKEHLAGLVGDDAKAADLMLQVSLYHGYLYTSSRPVSFDFVAHMKTAAKDILSRHLSDGDVTKVVDFMQAEAVRRDLVSASTNSLALRGGAPAGITFSEKKRRDRLRGALGGTAPESGHLRATIGSLLQGDTGHQVTLHEVKRSGMAGLEKSIFQAHIEDPHTGEPLPVVDGHVSVLTKDGVVENTGGRGWRLPAQVDFTPATIDAGALMAETRDAMKAALLANYDHAEVQEQLGAQFDDAIDAPLRDPQRVISEGKVWLEVRTAVGRFLIDPHSKEVRTSHQVRVHSFGAEHSHDG